MLFGSNDLAAFCMAAVCARPGKIFGHRSHFAKNAWPLSGNEVSFILCKADRKMKGYKLMLASDPLLCFAHLCHT